MSLKYELSSKPLHISAKELFLHRQVRAQDLDILLTMGDGAPLPVREGQPLPLQKVPINFLLFLMSEVPLQ